MSSPLVDDRAAVFAAVREALASRTEKAPLPDWDASEVVCRPPQAFSSLAEHFAFKFQAAGGIVIHGWNAIAALIAERGLQRGYTDPAFLPQLADVKAELVTQIERPRIDELEFGITAATAGIAESGSLMLTASGSSSRLGALAPWLHIAVLREADLLPTIPSAIERFGDERLVAFVTGPSKTADVEGILIQGVHGPGVQVCCLVQD